mgnify:CR=1 FL=1|jgi:hypothetical protein
MQQINTELKSMPENIKINHKKFQKMLFLHNAIEDGWTVKKTENHYIFSKKHENRKEVYQKSFLEKFILSNQEVDNISEMKAY